MRIYTVTINEWDNDVQMMNTATHVVNAECMKVNENEYVFMNYNDDANSFVVVASFDRNDDRTFSITSV